MLRDTLLGTRGRQSSSDLLLRLCVTGICAFAAGRSIAQVLWSGNVPSIIKVGDAWQVTNAIPDLYAKNVNVTDTNGNALFCVERNSMVGTHQGVIDDAAIRFREFTFDTPQNVTWERKSYEINTFVFAFHGDPNLYSKIPELSVSTTFSGKMGWTITNSEGKKFALKRLEMLSKGDCRAVYEGGVTIAENDFLTRYKGLTYSRPNGTSTDVQSNKYDAASSGRLEEWALQGDVTAQCLLAALLYDGKGGLATNRVDAYKWASLAARSDRAGKSLVDQFELFMSTEEINRGKEAAKGFLKEHPSLMPPRRPSD